ncbi:MAG: D-aminoacylase [Planctomycetales bacterium]|nr:D-aminoacylase [Planctomycetales bacterium]
MCALLIALVVAASGPVEADLVIRNARIMDGTGGEAIMGDVAIRGDRIVGVGQFEVSGKPREIDAAGLIVAPGFIDLHNHSDTPITQAATRLNRNFITQGVTTIVTGNCGSGRLDVRRYFEEIDEAGAGTNVAHLIPQGKLRASVIGEQKRPATDAEVEKMKQQVDQAMKAGAFGMSTGLIYVPSKYASTDELIALAGVVGQHGGIYVSHMRGEGTTLLDSVEEILRIGRESKLPVHISHFKASGEAAWGLAAEAVRMVQAARADGQRVTADQYPYIASSTSLGAMVVPDELRDRDELAASLKDPERAEKTRRAIQREIDERRGGGSLFVARYAKQPAWQGKSIAAIAEQEQREPLEIVLEIQLNGGAQMVNFGMNEEEVRLIMREPFVATASDGGAKTPDDTVPHPRNYGTFPRRLGLYSVELGLTSLEQAVRASSGLPADILGLKDRGYLKPGLVADVVVFDPETLRDTATFEKPHQYSTGVRYLLVNGQLAIDKGEVTGKLPGRAVRKPPGE